MNMNELAKRVSKLEGGKVNLTIAQIKECLACTWEVLYKNSYKAKKKTKKGKHHGN